MIPSQPLRVVIVDDEAGARESLAKILKRDFPMVELLGTAEGVTSGEKLIRSVQPDCILLDIEMVDGTGFDLLDALGEVDSAVIFTTGFDQFALKAFRYLAMDYLLKPVDPGELGEALGKIRRTQQYSALQVKAVLEAVQKRSLGKIAVSDASGLTFVRIGDIVHCQSYKNYTDIHTSRGKKITASKTLKHFEELLPTEMFFRIHQSHLINLNHVERYLKLDGGRVLMDNGADLEVSRRRKEQLIQRLAQL